MPGKSATIENVKDLVHQNHQLAIAVRQIRRAANVAG